MTETQIENLTPAEIQTLAVALDSIVNGPGYGNVVIEVRAGRIQTIAVTVTIKPAKE